MNRDDWAKQRMGVRKFLSWIEDNQSRNHFDLSQLLQFEQDFIKEQESDLDEIPY